MSEGGRRLSDRVGWGDLRALDGGIFIGCGARDEGVPWLVYAQGDCALGPLAGLFVFWGPSRWDDGGAAFGGEFFSGVSASRRSQLPQGGRRLSDRLWIRRIAAVDLEAVRSAGERALTVMVLVLSGWRILPGCGVCGDSCAHGAFKNDEIVC
jgi:hypothetical protein